MSNLLEKNHLVTIDLRLPRKQQLIFNSKAPSVTNFFFIGKGTEEGYINKKRAPNNQPKAYRKYTTDAYRQKTK